MWDDWGDAWGHNEYCPHCGCLLEDPSEELLEGGKRSVSVPQPADPFTKYCMELLNGTLTKLHSNVSGNSSKSKVWYPRFDCPEILSEEVRK